MYRGRSYYCEDILNDDFSFEEETLVAPPPIINEKGEKIVADGNEYGVYMSDNLRMVKDVYGNVHSWGHALTKDITIGNFVQICTPKVAVIYAIDTNGLEIKIPKIIDALKDLYNNGYEGDEWIAESVPKKHYKIIQITIGEGYLHPKEVIKSYDEKTTDIVKGILTKRKKIGKILLCT